MGESGLPDCREGLGVQHDEQQQAAQRPRAYHGGSGDGHPRGSMRQAGPGNGWGGGDFWRRASSHRYYYVLLVEDLKIVANHS